MSATLGKRRRGKQAEPETHEIEAPPPQKQISNGSGPPKPVLNFPAQAEPSSLDFYVEVIPYKSNAQHFKVVVSQTVIYSVIFTRNDRRTGNASAHLQLLQLKSNPAQLVLFYICEGNNPILIKSTTRRGKKDEAPPEVTGFGANGEIEEGPFETLVEGIARFNEVSDILIKQGYEHALVNVLTNRLIDSQDIQKKFTLEVNSLAQPEQDFANFLLEYTDPKTLEEYLRNKGLNIEEYKSLPMDIFEIYFERSLKILKEISDSFLNEEPGEDKAAELKSLTNKWFQVFPFTLTPKQIELSTIDTLDKLKGSLEFLKLLHHYEEVYASLLRNQASYDGFKTQLFTNLIATPTQSDVKVLTPTEEARTALVEAFKKSLYHKPENETWEIEEIYSVTKHEPPAPEPIQEEETGTKKKKRTAPVKAKPAPKEADILIPTDQLWWSEVNPTLIYPVLRYGLIDERLEHRLIYLNQSPFGVFETLHEVAGHALDVESTRIYDNVVYLLAHSLRDPLDKQNTLSLQADIFTEVATERKRAKNKGEHDGKTHLLRGLLKPSVESRQQINDCWSATLDQASVEEPGSSESIEATWRKLVTNDPKALIQRYLIRVRLSTKLF